MKGGWGDRRQGYQQALGGMEGGRVGGSRKVRGAEMQYHQEYAQYQQQQYQQQQQEQQQQHQFEYARGSEVYCE